MRKKLRTLYNRCRTTHVSFYLAERWEWFNHTFSIIEPDDPEPADFQSAWFDLQSKQGIAAEPHRWQS